MIVNVELTPNVDTDQSASAQAQINAAPSGTAGNPTYINMPLGRYRTDRGLRCTSKEHVRWTCLAGEPTYPNPPDDTQAFIGYTDKTGIQLGMKTPGTTRSNRYHFFINGTDVVGSFLRAEGPFGTVRNAGDPLYARYSRTYEAEHAFIITQRSQPDGSIECGWEDCSFQNVGGDAFFVGGFLKLGGVWQTNHDIHVHRLTGQFASRMLFGICNVDGFEAIDASGPGCGWGTVDLEPELHQVAQDCTFTRVKGSCLFYWASHSAWWAKNPDFGGSFSLGPVTYKDCEVLATSIHAPAVATWVSGSDLTIDGMIDHRPSNQLTDRCVAGFNSNIWENVTVKNSTLKAWLYATTKSYGVAQRTSGALTITNNVFAGKTTELHSPNINMPGGTFEHYGNVWSSGALNDGGGSPAGVNLAAFAGEIAIQGGTATLDIDRLTAAGRRVRMTAGGRGATVEAKQSGTELP